MRRRRSAGRGPAVGTQPVQHLPAEPTSLLQQEGQAEILPGGRPCAPVDPANSRPAQVVGSLGRPLHRQQGPGQRLLLLDRRPEAQGTQEGRLRQRNGATMERESSSKILQQMQYVSRPLLFVFWKYQDSGAPESDSGTAPFCYLYDKNYAFKYNILFIPFDPGST